jgi:hypothetical protein
VKRTSYEAPHCAVFSSLPLKSKHSSHTRTKQQVNLWFQCNFPVSNYLRRRDVRTCRHAHLCVHFVHVTTFVQRTLRVLQVNSSSSYFISLLPFNRSAASLLSRHAVGITQEKKVPLSKYYFSYISRALKTTHKQQQPMSWDKWRAVTALTFLLGQTKEWRCTHTVTWMIITSRLWTRQRKLNYSSALVPPSMLPTSAHKERFLTPPDSH